MDKEKLKEACLQKITVQKLNLQNLINEVQQASNNETKSTAGDKHDTARAQAQIEVERLSNQMELLNKLQSDLMQLPTNVSTKIQLGSFVCTSIGNFYVSQALGKMQYQDLDFFAISTSSPLYSVLHHKSKGDSFTMLNGQTAHITSVK
jgi:hypothetical protein